MLYDRYLYHHGILGQRWGRKNGPPYPLDASDHSKSEKIAGWRKSINKSSSGLSSKNRTNKDIQESSGHKIHLTKAQKKAIIIGAGVAAAGLVVYGAYKTGALDSIGVSSSKTTPSFPEFNNLKMDSKAMFDMYLDDLKSGIKEASNAAKSAKDNIVNFSSESEKIKYKPGRIQEGIAKSLMESNPYLNDSSGGGRRNCTACSVTGILRQLGYNVTAKAFKGFNDGLTIDEYKSWLNKCFPNMKPPISSEPMTAVKFARSVRDAEEMLLKRYGQSAKGIVALSDIKGQGSGHAFSWEIKDGKVSFYDFQQRLNDAGVRNRVFPKLVTSSDLLLARLDNSDIDFKEIAKYIDIHK